MNTPGTDEGNWAWQAPEGAFDQELAARLRVLLEQAGRAAPRVTDGVS
jgi:4-alpha-glucanotransferase